MQILSNNTSDNQRNKSASAAATRIPSIDDSLVIWSDGSSLGNPGPGGYGVIIASKKFGEVIELGGSKPTTTNNEMEVTAIVAALSYAVHNSESVHIFTDSSYLINGAQSWMYGWKRNNWCKADGEEIKNRYLWESLYGLVTERGRANIFWHHVPSHIGIPGNERVDTIARGFAGGDTIELFRGKLEDYSVREVFTFPLINESSDAPTKKKSSSTPAYSYLSEVDGVIRRHQSWASCEALVRGKKARFKKATSQQDEVAILASWGHTPDAVTHDRE